MNPIRFARRVILALLWVWLARIPVEAAPDLAIIAAPGVAPSPITAGNAIHVACTVRNLGTDPSGSSHLLLRVFYPGGGLLLSTNVPVVAIAAGGQIVVPVDVAIPLEAEGGSYRLFALADP